jgi:hypothetical protein
LGRELLSKKREKCSLLKLKLWKFRVGRLSEAGGIVWGSGRLGALEVQRKAIRGNLK